MKNYLMFALILCAIPAVAVGQTVNCDTCTHVLSVYEGEGGFIAMTDAEEVTFVASCNGVTRSGELTPNDDGMVAMLLAGDYQCHGDEDASFKLGPIMDGGWYWLTMEDNSAVGGLVAMDILENDMVDIADAGEGVTLTMGSGAVLLTESATGRVGILPNILPEPPAAAPTPCGAYRKADKTVGQVASSCMLGDGSTKVRIVGPGSFGRSSESLGSATVYRNVTGNVTVTMDLWTTGGIIAPDPTATAQPVGTGYAGLGTGLSFTNVTPSVSGFGASVAEALGAGNATVAVAQGDVSATPPTSDTATVTIEDATTSVYCTATASHDAVVSFAFLSDQGNVLPAPKALDRENTIHGTAELTIKCPPSADSANQGQELVPENPFPTSE